MTHDDCMIRDDLSRSIRIFQNEGLVTTSLELIVNKIMLGCIESLPLGEPYFFFFGHLIVKLIHLSECDDVWNRKVGAD